VLAFYVIHHPVVLTLAAFVVTWPLGVWPKFLLIAIPGYAISYALCVAARRWSLTRAVFGLRTPDVTPGVGRTALVPAWKVADAGVRRLNQ
jgi:hypothetical protein